MALEQIRPIDVQEPDRVDVQRRVIDAVQADPERFLAAYAAHKDSFGGRYVCADLMKDVIPEYAASKETRGRYNGVVHNAAAVLAAEQYRRVIADDSDPARDRALFVTGMPGAGKTSTVQATALQAGGKLGDDVRVVYEGQLIDPASSIQKIGQALDAGCVVSIAAVLPRAEQALEFSFNRFAEYGRGAGVGVMARIQENTPDGLSAISERFGDKVAIGVYDVRDRDKPARHEGAAGIEVWKEELSHGSVRERLNAEFERRKSAGLVTDDCARQFNGQAPYPELFDVRGRDVGQRAKPEPERSPPQRSGGENLLSLGRGSTLADLAAKVPAGRAIPDGAERIVVLNSSRLHERRFEGNWEVQKSDPQGMLPKGVFRLDTATPAKPDDGATYAGSILHVSAKGVYQVHGNGVARHDPASFQQVPKVGDSPKIVYANGRATIPGRDLPPPSQSKGRGR